MAAPRGKQHTVCEQCGGAISDRTNPHYDALGPQVWRLWCPHCGTLHIVEAWITNMGPDSEGFVKSERLLDLMVPAREQERPIKTERQETCSSSSSESSAT